MLTKEIKAISLEVRPLAVLPPPLTYTYIFLTDTMRPLGAFFYEGDEANRGLISRDIAEIKAHQISVTTLTIFFWIRQYPYNSHIYRVMIYTN